MSQDTPSLHDHRDDHNRRQHLRHHIAKLYHLLDFSMSCGVLWCFLCVVCVCVVCCVWCGVCAGVCVCVCVCVVVVAVVLELLCLAALGRRGHLAEADQLARTPTKRTHQIAHKKLGKQGRVGFRLPTHRVADIPV